MSQPFKVAVITGSLRKDSISRKYAEALVKLAPASLKLETVEIGDLPFYNPDDDGPNAPASWQRLRSQIKAADAVLFVTPEYNRSIPAVLKNAIDVASRPYGQGAWGGKPGAVISVSPGGLGGFGAAQHLRQILVVLNVTAMAVEATIGGADKHLGADGSLANESTANFLADVLTKFSGFIAVHTKA